MSVRYDEGTWDRIERLLAQATVLPTGKREAFLDELARDRPEVAAELVSLLSLSPDSSRFFRKLERRLFKNDEEEDTGAVFARFDPLVGETIRGRYTLEEVRGRGGMGTVYRATDTDTGDRVAVKTLSERLCADRAGRRRFFREARTARKVQHPNVCPVLDAGEGEDGTLYLVMPLYEGVTLARRLRRGRLPLEEAVDWLEQACAGLAAIHAARIVHRDLAPSNLLRTPEGTVIVLDFGLARLANATLGTRSRELGTLPYMAPEQLADRKVDRRVDVWAMAVIFYEMVTGSRPFSGRSIAEVHDAILERQPPSLAELRPEVPEGLAAAVSRALAKLPGDRLSRIELLAKAASRAS